MAIETDALKRVVTAKPASAQEEVIERALRPRGAKNRITERDGPGTGKPGGPRRTSDQR